jgi:hypothetical protein
MSWVTESEVILPKPPKTLDDVRVERELLFSALKKYNGAWWAAMTSAQRDEVSQYRLDLLDITTQDPTNVTWPTPPSF